MGGRFVFFHGKRHPRDMGADEVNGVSTHLARVRWFPPRSESGPCRLLFLYGEVLGVRLRGCRGSTGEAAGQGAVVLTRDEVRRAAFAARGTKWLMASLLYGAGLRLRECLGCA